MISKERKQDTLYPSLRPRACRSPAATIRCVDFNGVGMVFTCGNIPLSKRWSVSGAADRVSQSS